jgi:hypothetical protein
MKKLLRTLSFLLPLTLLLLISGAWRIADTKPMIYPNPATDYISLSDAREVQQLILYNLTGREVLSFPASAAARYNISQLPNGMYLVQFLNAEKRVLHTQRLQKR